MTSPSQPLNDTLDLLDIQGRALLAGDLGALMDMPKQLEQALEQLLRDPPSPADLARLSSVAARNTALLHAAQVGIACIRDMRSGPFASPLATYDSAGRSLPVMPLGRTLARG